MSTFVLFI
jgi:hypothetical protein